MLLIPELRKNDSQTILISRPGIAGGSLHRSSAEPRILLGMVPEITDVTPQSIWVGRREGEAVLPFPDQVAYACLRRGDHRQTARHRLQAGERKAVGKGVENHDLRLIQKLLHPLARQMTVEMDVGTVPVIVRKILAEGLADQVQLRPGKLPEQAEQMVDALSIADLAYVDKANGIRHSALHVTERKVWAIGQELDFLSADAAKGETLGGKAGWR